MIFSKSLPRLSVRGSSKAKPRVRARSVDELINNSSLFLNRQPLEFDLLSQIVHIASLATSGMSRDALFAQMAELPYCTAAYFRRVHYVAQRLNYDYSRACQIVADSTKVEPVRNLLLRFASALSAGESEETFLQREMNVQLEEYSSKYHRDIETLQKWTDAFVALSVSATLIVVVSLVSTMIYSIGSLFILAMAGIVVAVNALGVWIIFRTAPHEVKSSRLPERSEERERAIRAATICIPVGAVAGLAAAIMFGVGAGLMVVGLALIPPGVFAIIDDLRIDGRDRAVADFFRALGGIVGAVGATLLDGLQRLNRRSLGALAPMVERLEIRLKGQIRTELCWYRFTAESGSELVDRATRMFFSAMQHGGDATRVGKFVSDYAMKVTILRANRKLVANTFTMLMIPLHAVLVAIILFVTQVLVVFATELARIEQESFQDSSLAADAGFTSVLTFAAPNVSFITAMATGVILILTVTNSLAPYVASGGHRLRLCIFAAAMLIMSGLSLMFIPAIVQGLFANVSGDLQTTATPPPF
ncbi:MAG TPA: hypothetical protein VNN12_05840 [Dehalococcoidia bacterium]|nr:hypothetical protein [Dehalococcoidia bacterium]